MLVKTLKRAGFGFLAGVAIGNLITALTGSPNLFSAALLAKMGSLNAALLVHTLLSGVLGAVSFAGTMLYELERWPLALVALVHYAVIEAVYAVIALILGWAGSAGELLAVMAIQLVVYLVIFFIMYARYRAEIRKLNELQKERNEQQENGGNKGK